MFTIPTDRLSKFLAIAGVAIAVSSIGFWYVAYDEQMREHYRLREEMRPLDEKSKLLEYNRPPEFNEDCLAKKAGDIADCLKRQNDSLEKSMEHNRKEMELINERTAKTIASADQFDIAISNYKSKTIICLVGLIFGLVLSFFGFRSWRKFEQKA